MILYQNFRRESVNYLPQFLPKPKLTKAVNFELPRASILHYLGEGPDDPGPPNNYKLFESFKRIIPIYHVVDGVVKHGTFQKLGMVVEGEINKYQNRNRNKYRRVFQYDAGLKDRTVPFIISYTYILRQWIYRGQRELIPYNKNLNMWETVINQMVNLGEITDYNQFIIIDTPLIIPPLSLLRKTEKNKELRIEVAKKFNTFDKIFIYQLFLWLGNNRKFSIFNNIPEKSLNKINFIISDNGVYTILNLGDLNSMRKGEGESKGMPPQLLQLKLLQFYISFSKVRQNSVEEIEKSYIEDAVNELNDNETNVNISENNVNENNIKDDHKLNIDGEIITDDENDENTDKELNEEYDAIENEIEKENNKTYILNEDTDTVTEIDNAKINSESREIRILEDKISEELEVLEDINKEAEIVEGDETEPTEIKDDFKVEPLEKGIEVALNELNEQGSLSLNDFRKFKKLANSYKTITYPGTDITLENFIKVSKEDEKVEEVNFRDIPSVVDKNMLKSTLPILDKKYITKILPKDCVKMVLGIQNAGVCVTDYKITHQENAMGKFEDHVVRLVPVQGQPSTLRFKLPSLTKDGVMESNGIKYRLRKQKRDLPIRKVSDTRVALTSYYGKIFIERSQKKINNYGSWLLKNIRAAGLDRDNQIVLKTRTYNVFDYRHKVPYIYSTLAKGFRSVTTDKYYLNFDYNNRENKFGKEVITALEKDGAVVVGMIISSKEYIVVKDDNHFYYVKDLKDKVPRLLGTIEDLVNFNIKNAPIESVELTVISKSVPLGIVLGYEMGFNNLISRLNVSYRRVPTGERLRMEANEYCIQFEDETLIFKRDNRLASLLLSGFMTYQRSIKEYPISSFNKRDVYLNILEVNNITTRFLNEIDLMFKMFIDPITLQLLQEMNEPTQFRGLLFRATELLLTDDHPSEVDASQMRICGNERIAGTIYTEVVKSLRQHFNRGNRKSFQVDVNPNAVWLSIANDPAKRIVEELNPIQNLKQYEAVTFSGNGGRSRETMVQRTRVYDKNDLGIVSEATVDSGDVGINVFLSSNPNIKSVYGLGTPVKVNPNEEPDLTRLFSTSSNLSVGVEKDDSKRRGFVNIMHDHTVPCKNYGFSPVSTGYEKVIAHRTSDLFASAAEDDGEVVNVTNNVLIIKLNNGEHQKIQIGRRFGSSGGLTVPHVVKTELRVGDKVTKDQIVSYNPAFFGKDPFDNKTISWKTGYLARTILVEDALTLEDSSAISEEVSDALTTYSTKEKNIVVSFDQEIHNLVNIGQDVKVDSVLCLIEESVTANAKLFDEDSLNALKQISNMSPRAEFPGRIEKIDVFYNGEKEEMSNSLREIANSSDKRMSSLNKSLGKKAFGGLVTEDYRVDGNPLEFNQAVIKIYITGLVGANSGDKGVLGNQMKTTFAKVYSKDSQPYTEDGNKIDVLFGAKSVAARIVDSMYIIGTTNSLLKTISKKASDIYFGED